MAPNWIRITDEAFERLWALKKDEKTSFSDVIMKYYPAKWNIDLFLPDGRVDPASVPRLIVIVNAGDPAWTKQAAEALFLLMTTPSAGDPLNILGQFLENPAEKTIAVAEEVFYRVLYHLWGESISPEEGDTLMKRAASYAGNPAVMNVAVAVRKRLEEEYRYGL
jgi:predicted CopG family antitoxin